jgi:hypothetical protein
MRIELIYDADCPNTGKARAALLKAFSLAGIQAEWIELERNAPDTPAYARGFGSPTILVDGRDVAGYQASGEQNCCRLYPRTDGGFEGAPSAEEIADVLRRER